MGGVGGKSEGEEGAAVYSEIGRGVYVDERVREIHTTLKACVWKERNIRETEASRNNCAEMWAD